MDRHGQRFLADAALALDQDGGAGAGGLGRDRQCRAEIGRIANDLVKGQEGGNLLGQGRSSPLVWPATQASSAASSRSGPAA